jgi:sulfate adenylyltransferase
VNNLLTTSSVWRDKANQLPALILNNRQKHDLELLLNGAFYPLTGFMNQADYYSVCEKLCLTTGELWPIPVTLDVDAATAATLEIGQEIALRDSEGLLLATLAVNDRFQADKIWEALQVYGTADPIHPGVKSLLQQQDWYIGGTVTADSLPTHYDFLDLRFTPQELRKRFQKLGWKKIVAFQTRNPLHRAHVELTFRAAQAVGGNLLLHPVVGTTRPGDVDAYTRVRCYRAILPKYPAQSTMLAVLPLAMRMAGPKEALWHALIRQNYGATHFIVGRDHAGPGNDAQGKPFYDPYSAQELIASYKDKLSIQMIPQQEIVYSATRVSYISENEVQPGESVLRLSGTEFRRRLQHNLEIPEWFSYPEVLAELRRVYKPRSAQGVAVFFTGLSGAGKSTIAQALQQKLLEYGRHVTLLDGDVSRRFLSSELTFSKEHRDLNVRRIGYVAAEIVKHGGLVLCASIAPYQATRQWVREHVELQGGFIEVYVATSLEICESRDRKGLYKKARAGLIPQFTGISDPYEPPENPELVLDTAQFSPEETAQEVFLLLERLGYLTLR